MIWAAGTRANDAADWIGAATARNKAVVVNADCSVPGQPNVFVIGDAASYVGEDDKPLPSVAPVAKQQGRYVGKLIYSRIERRSADRMPSPIPAPSRA